MRLEQTPRPEHALRVTARLITSSTILHLSADELEHTLNQEQTENPALEVEEKRICLCCGTPLYSQSVCTICGRFAQNAQPLNHSNDALAPYEHNAEAAQQVFYDIDNYGFAEADNDDEYDPIARIPADDTLTETLLQQLEALITPDDAPIAEQLVGNLNERGYLEISVLEIANHLQIVPERVEYVLSQLQTLEPLGIGARDPRECLLIQLQALSEQTTPHPLAHILIDRYLDYLGRNQLHEIARQLKIPLHDVRQASLYIRSTLHPFPAHVYRADSYCACQDSGTTYIRPDVLIRKGETGFEIELVEDKRYKFSIRTHYPEQQVPLTASNDVQRYIHQHRDRAKFFIDCIHRRWQTLRRVTETRRCIPA